MIDTGEMGTVLQLEGTHTAAGGFKPDLPAWRRDAAECPFGGMTGLGVHTVDTFHYFVGRAKRVVAFSTKVEGWSSLDEATAVTIEYERGPIGTIGTCYFTPPIVKLGVLGSEASAWNEQDGAQLLTQARGDATRTEQPVETMDTVADELAEFARCIRGEATPETGAAEGIEVAAVLEGIGRSLDSGCAVDVAELR
jgi:predicted dehydrogenase